MIVNSVVEIAAGPTDFEDLPDNVTALFTEFEADAYRQGMRTIKDSLEATGEPCMAAAVDCLRPDHPFRVCIENFLTSPSIWFCFSHFELQNEIRVKLQPSKREHPQLSDRLSRIYRQLAGLTSSNPYFPRLVEPERLRCPGVGENYWVLLSYGNGDALVSDENGSTQFFAHAASSFTEISEAELLDPFLEKLFATVF